MPQEESNYYEINEFAAKPTYKRVSPPRAPVHTRRSPMEHIPAYPSTQPPSHPPQNRNGSAGSSANGYYSSNSSVLGSSYAQNQQQMPRRGSFLGRQSISSRAASVDEEDDGFYDNIGIFDDRRLSRGSEMDNASLSSRQLPPNVGKSNNNNNNKFGSFLRRFGGNSKPPGSAASLISLNKVPHESSIQSSGLMKSNSLSTEPWKKHILNGPSLPRDTNKSGFGARLKNSLFGSKKRVNNA